MAERVHFRTGASGHSEVFGTAVSVSERRVKFTKGWVTGGTDPGDGSVECGDGTDFPLLVTLKQLREIMHVAKVAWMNAGSFTINYEIDYGGGGDPESVIVKHYAPAEDPDTAQLVRFLAAADVGANFAIKLGYHTADEVPDITLDHEDGLFGEEYEVSYPDGYVDPLFVRDIGDSERAMWVFPDTLSGHPRINKPADFRCGLSYYAGSPNNNGGGQTYGGGDEGPGQFDGHTPCTTREDGMGFSDIDLDLDVFFSGLVAYTGDHPLDPAGELYVGVRFVATGISGTGVSTGVVLGTRQTTPSTDLAVGFDFVIRLSGAVDLSCPLYSSDVSNVSYVSHSGADWVLEVKEWWPYKTLAGDPAYITTTGLPANGGPLN